jgi:hypothetical protein
VSRIGEPHSGNIGETDLNKKGKNGGIIMETIIGDFLEQLKVGRKQSHKNLALYPPLWNLCAL